MPRRPRIDPAPARLARRRIDAHQHFWRLARGDYGWITPALGPIYRDFGPGDLAPLLAGAGIGETILVQAAPTAAETRYLLHTARATTFVAGVVGWLDMTADDAPAALARLAEDEYLLGVRPMIHDIPDPGWMLASALAPAFRTLVELDLVFDALVRPAHLANLRTLLGRVPDLRVVIDHGAKPDIARWTRARQAPDDAAAWQATMADLARSPRVACKLSGLATEAGPRWQADHLRPYVDHLLACFGPDRLLWGSDWPVVDLAGGYGAWWTATGACLDGVDAGAREQILGLTAARVYGL
jgi:L-fucono-1,5-lactonase